MTGGFYGSLGIDPVINAVGPATRLGNCILSRPVLDAMAEAANAFVLMDELEERAGEVIADITGAEAGYVTNGAAGALTLAAAACIAGSDPTIMNRLPDVGDLPNEIVIHRAHRYDYDHALRAAGARLVEVGFPDLTFAYEVEAAITSRTVAFAFNAAGSANVVSLHEMVSIAHRHGLPVIVDAAVSVPPVENLRRFCEEGADLVAFSGGKWIGGPPASGFLAGRAALIRSVALQHQDMDVRPATWSGHRLIEEGVLPGPPYQGIGRGLKVGKEEIAGLITALRLYVARDHLADQARWKTVAQNVVDAVRDLPGVSAAVIHNDVHGERFAVAEIFVDSSVVGRSAYEIIAAMARGTPRIYLAEDAAWRNAIRVTPTSLRDGEDEIVAAALSEALRARPAVLAHSHGQVP